MCTPCRTTDGVNAKSYLVTIEIQQIFNHVGKLLPIYLIVKAKKQRIVQQYKGWLCKVVVRFDCVHITWPRVTIRKV